MHQFTDNANSNALLFKSQIMLHEIQCSALANNAIGNTLEKKVIDPNPYAYTWSL